MKGLFEKTFKVELALESAGEPFPSETGVQWLSGRVLDSRQRDRGSEPHRRHCVVSLSKNINPSLVLVQPRKTRTYITERLLMGRKQRLSSWHIPPAQSDQSSMGPPWKAKGLMSLQVGGSNLTVALLCPWAKYFIRCLVLVQPTQEYLSWHDWKIVDWDKKIKTNKTAFEMSGYN